MMREAHLKLIRSLKLEDLFANFVKNAHCIEEISHVNQLLWLQIPRKQLTFWDA